MCETKVCGKCKEIKPLYEFYKCSKCKDKLQYQCKECDKDNLVKRKNSQKEEVVDGRKTCNVCQINREVEFFCKDTYSKDGHDTTCNLCKKEQRVITYPLYKDRIMRYGRKRYKLKSTTDPVFKLTKNYRAIIQKRFLYYVSGGIPKEESSREILKCEFKELFLHLEKQFLCWMSWENHGNCQEKDYNCSWHMDHIIPVSHAKNKEDLITLNHWSNFQPLCGKRNLEKLATVYPCTNLELGITFWEDRWEYV